jgi:transposase
VAQPFDEAVKQILSAEPELPTVEIMRRVRLAGYDGRKTAFYEMVRALRPIVTRPMVRFEGVAGEFSQNDFGQVRVKYDDGTVEIIHFFAARLKWSRWMHVEIVENEQVESLVRALLSSFESFGGVPHLCVFDNPKTVVDSRIGNVIEWNSTFAQVAIDYRFAVELCWPRQGNQKGSVENLVGFVKNGLFKVRRFHDRADLHAQLREWLHEVNYERPCRATDVTPEARIVEERRRLRPLPIPAAGYALRFPVRVGPTGWVTHDGIRYSMPPKSIGFNGTLFLYRARVRIVAGMFTAEHPRHPHNGVSTLPDHAAETLAAVSGTRGEHYYRRQRLLELGEPAEAFITELVNARPRVWYPDVEHLFRLLTQHGPERMAVAFQQALERGWYGAEHVEQLLRMGGD